MALATQTVICPREASMDDWLMVAMSRRLGGAGDVDGNGERVFRGGVALVMSPSGGPEPSLPAQAEHARTVAATAATPPRTVARARTPSSEQISPAAATRR